MESRPWCSHWWAETSVYRRYETLLPWFDHERSRGRVVHALGSFADLDRFAPQSCSGGGWGPDGRLYSTGHDRGEIYQLELPKASSTLVLTKIIPVEIAGQGIAWDTSRPGVL